ncbi:unnamed protein product [Schistocephalus solidus]|uniref:Delta-like protein n=1 Tax=Schistocephalus solidus TaxID=70667 RepID=A0A183SE56_SCHSO|nr:unnamed protein product [Schistocephalus solidus]
MLDNGFFFYKLCILLICLRVTLGNGTFQMLIQDFQVDDNFPAWRCCYDTEAEAGSLDEQTFAKCLSKCQFMIKVGLRMCLEEYQPVWTAKQEATCPLGHSDGQLPATRPDGPLLNLSSPVPKKWKENFTLILDVLHFTGKNAPPKLLFRLPSSEINFTSLQNWKSKTFGSQSWGQSQQSGHTVADDNVRHQGIGLKIVTFFQFTCSAGYYGPFCERRCDSIAVSAQPAECRPPSDRILCPTGYEGPRCDKRECAATFHSLPKIDDYYLFSLRCQQGWSGADCSLCRAYPGCVHGTCKRDPITGALVPFTCVCEKRWGGMLCDIELQFCQNHPNTCKNRGKCENVQRTNNQPYRCVCAPGFRGDHCEMIQLDCQFHGCRNGGECTQHSDGQGRCICPQGFYGSLCQFNQTSCAENPCQAPNSVCHPMLEERSGVRHRGRQFVCECPPGYSGDNCEINTDECVDKPCKNGAFCEDLVSGYRCICPAGYTGVWCEKNVTRCTADSCPKGSPCVNTDNGFQCSPSKSFYSATTAATITKISQQEPRQEQKEGHFTFSSSPVGSIDFTKKNNVVMVHLQPSFLSLTLGVPVAIVFCGLLLAMLTCAVMAVCMWRKGCAHSSRKCRRTDRTTFSQQNQSLDDEPNVYASETSTIWSNYEPIASLRPVPGKTVGLPRSASAFYPTSVSSGTKRLELMSTSTFEMAVKQGYNGSERSQGVVDCGKLSRSSSKREINSGRVTSVYQRYSENPTRSYSLYFMPSFLYGYPLQRRDSNASKTPSLPPRPSSGRPVTYSTFLRPVLFPIHQQHQLKQQEASPPLKISESSYATITEPRAAQ